jgi:nitronate monooxygenase
MKGLPSALPIMQAPIGPAGSPGLVAAASAAGALGTLAASWTDADVLRRQIREIAAASDGPYCVNLVLAFDQRQRLEVALEEGVRVVSFSWGIDDALIRRARQGGAAVFVQVGTVADAIRAESAGADMIIAQGVEAGGHVQSTTPLLDLVADVRRSVRCSVIAAGGIASPAAARRAIAAGADAVAIGTAFLAAREANVHPHYVNRLLMARSQDTVLTEVYDEGWPNAPHRVLRNETVLRWEAAGEPRRGARPGEGDVIARRDDLPVVRYSDAQPTRNTTGDIEAMAMYAGQSVGEVEGVGSAASVVVRIALGL